MTKDEALKLALKALEWTLPLIEDFGNKEQLNKQHKAIASLYEAQAQPAQKTATGIQYAQGIPFFIPPSAQPAQEPVAWMNKHGACMSAVFKAVDATAGEYTTPLYTIPQPAQEPDTNEETVTYVADVLEGKKRKQRPWVGLTDDEIMKIIHSNTSAGLWLMAIEIGAKLKEKNT